ncbi:MAG: MBL fold metallo-hydrolase [Sporomusaceae bacterium]|nr:MBL fold metallo-hydrolase [Sporomusaceae bacterium]
MVEEIRPGIFRITVPLPDHPLKTVNSYVIASGERSLLVDTGWNRSDCVEALLDGLDAIGIKRCRTDLFLTHIHADHAGLTDLFSSQRAKIFCGQADIDNIDHFINTGSDRSWQSLKALAAPHGFSAAELEAAIEAHSGNRYKPFQRPSLSPVTGQDRLVVGKYTLTCIATPGHTLGHTCLYDPARKIFFSGDCLLGQLFPTLSQWSLTDRNLAYYLEWLERAAAYPVELVLPGHWDEFSNFHSRLKATLAYQRQRNAEITALLASGSKRLNACQVAAAISWNQKHNQWIFFPIARKWSAVADTLAHLCYLRDQGLLSMHTNQAEVTWSLARQE